MSVWSASRPVCSGGEAGLGTAVLGAAPLEGPEAFEAERVCIAAPPPQRMAPRILVERPHLIPAIRKGLLVDRVHSLPWEFTELKGPRREQRWEVTTSATPLVVRCLTVETSIAKPYAAERCIVRQVVAANSIAKAPMAGSDVLKDRMEVPASIERR